MFDEARRRWMMRTSLRLAAVPSLSAISSIVALPGIPAIGAIAALSVTSAQAQDASAVYLYKGADRESKLVEGAKKEGGVTLYTSLATTESTPLAKAFEAKYGVPVSLWRATSDKVVQRSVTEAQARRYVVDVVETNGPELEMLTREKLTSAFESPYIADLPTQAIPKHRMWVSDRQTFFVVGFNTNKVKRAEIPKTLEGFLDPKWKGRIALEATDSEWMAGLYKVWGNERAAKFFQALSAMKPDMRKGHVLLSELLVAGEVELSLTIYNSNIETAKKKGAPVDWIAIEPVIARPQGLGVMKNAPHPHAALLFADFVLNEGQQLFNEMGRAPSSTKVKSTLNNFPYTMADPAITLDESAKWEKLWDELFIKNRR